MRRSPVVIAMLATVVAAGCTTSATPTPSATSTPTPIPPTSTPLGPATCQQFPFVFDELAVPPITDADHSHGPAEADIVVIDYADFQ